VKIVNEMAFSKDNSIIIFDLDDTLVVTNAKILVKDALTGETFDLTPQEFNEYEKEPHHEVDYNQFNDANILKAGRLVDWVLSILRSAYESGTAVGIITARNNKDLVREFLLSHGIDIHPKLVYAISDPEFEFEGTIAEKKREAFRKLIAKGFKHFTFYDDDRKNLDLAKSLEKEFSEITMKTRKIGRTQVPKLDIKTVGIFSGKFKPPHAGHYDAIAKIAEENDEVHIFISKTEMAGITGKAAQDVLDYYLEDFDNIELHLAEVTPVRSGYEFLEALGQTQYAPNTVVNLYATGTDMVRWAAAEKWKGSISKINRIETERPEFGGNSGADGDDDGVSGTLMREFWLAKDFTNFSQGIPEGKDPAKVWMILGGTIEEDLLTPELFRSRTVSNPDMDDLPTDRKPQRVSGTLRIPAQWGKYKGSVRENLTGPSRIKSFSEYISDK
jgi:cytidyltransferase-like protein